MLELGPAQIEVRMLSDECSWWKNSSSSGNASPVVKVKRLVLQRAAAEAAIEAEESSSTAEREEHELEVPASEVEPRTEAKSEFRKNVENGELKLNEIFGVPKMVIRKTSCRQYKSYLRTHRILQPVVCLNKDKRLDELALKCQQSSEPLSISVEDIEPRAVQLDAVNIELGEEIVTGVGEEVEVNQENGRAASAAVGAEDGGATDEQPIGGCENELMDVHVPASYPDSVSDAEVHNTQTNVDDIRAQEETSCEDSSVDQENPPVGNTVEELPEYCSSTNHFLVSDFYE